MKLFATSINPIDYKIRRGDMKDIMPLQLPAILGYDLAGQVVALGEGVTGVKVDALVLAVTEPDLRGVCDLQSRRPGAYAGWRSTPSRPAFCPWCC